MCAWVDLMYEFKIELYDGFAALAVAAARVVSTEPI